MLVSNIEKNEKVLSIIKQHHVPNIEQIARSAGLSRVTAKKYLDELVSAGTIKEARCGNSRIFLFNSTNERSPLSDVKSPISQYEKLSGDT